MAGPLVTVEMPASSPRGVAFSTVVLQIKTDLHARLVIQEVLAEEGAEQWVSLAADARTWKHPQVDKAFRVRVLRRAANNYPDNDPAAGRLNDYKTRTVAVDIFSRSTADYSGSDLVALTDAEYGLLTLEDAVLNALDLHTPANTEDEDAQIPYTVEPMREVQTDDPDRPRPGEGFIASSVYFEVKYIPLYRTDWH